LAENVLAEMDFCKIDTSLYIKVVMFDVKCKETSLKKNNFISMYLFASDCQSFKEQYWKARFLVG
jgi:hypothetical protein